MSASLYIGNVTHTRLKPARHRLRYRVFMGLFDIDRLAETARVTKFFGYNRGDLISFYDRDHGDGSGAPLRPQIERVLREAGLEAGGAIRVLCMPRVLGHVFNPLSVYFCYDRSGDLRAIVHEVNNTYGERHFYALPTHARAGARILQNCAKSFRVSPLLPMELDYNFAIAPPEEKVSINITAADARGPVLLASFAGERRAFSTASIIKAWLTHPALTWKVIAGIHWEALATFFKLGVARASSWMKGATRRRA